MFTLSLAVDLSWFMRSGTVAPRISTVVKAIDAHLVEEMREEKMLA